MPHQILENDHFLLSLFYFSFDLKDDKILCVALHPGWVKTDMGGSHAPLTVEESCREMTKTIFGLNESHNGGFIQYDGTKLEW